MTNSNENCTCLDDVPAKIKAANDLADVCVQVLRTLGVAHRPFNNIVITDMKGRSKVVPMNCKFCPFCGVKYK